MWLRYSPQYITKHIIPQIQRGVNTAFGLVTVSYFTRSHHAPEAEGFVLATCTQFQYNGECVSTALPSAGDDPMPVQGALAMHRVVEEISMQGIKDRIRAYVLGGGGARGALQVGALRGLLEAGIQPDLLVGTSVGAANATLLAMRGFSEEGLEELEGAWRAAAAANLLPDNYLWLTVRSLFDRAGTEAGQRIRDYFIAQGLDPSLRFGELQGPRLILVAADLAAGEAVLYGTDPDQQVLEGLLASTAIPPWVRPMARQGQRLMDGGLVSNLPIEPALRVGATDIVALDLVDPRLASIPARGFGSFVVEVMTTIEQRQIYLEKQLAAARRVPVHHVHLQPEWPIAVWEFPRALELLEPGYRMMRDYLAAHPELATSQGLIGALWWRRLWCALVRRRVPAG